MINKKFPLLGLLFSTVFALSACQSNPSNRSPIASPTNTVQATLSDPIFTLTRLSQQQKYWKGTRYQLGGTTRRGVDCSGFTQVTFQELFGIRLPRTTVDQAKMGVKVEKNDLKTGDLVFFKTGRGPNGRHVGIYVNNGQFLHASTKGGVIYSDIHSAYWSKTFWQARRL